MGALEDLALSLMGGETQKVIAAENPYYQFSAVPQIFGQAIQAQKPASRSEMWQQSMGGALSGLLGAGLQAYGNRYQNTLTDRYAQAMMGGSGEGLPPGLFGSAQRQRALFGLIRQIQAEEQQREIDKAIAIENAKSANELSNALTKEALTNPAVARRLSRLGVPIASGAVTPAPVGVAVPVVSGSAGAAAPPTPTGAPLQTGDTTQEQQYLHMVDELGIDPESARAFINNKNDIEARKAEELQKVTAPLWQEVTASRSTLDNLGYALERSRETGGIPFISEPIRSAKLLIGEQLGDSEAEKRRGGRADLTSQGILLAGQIRKLFTGATTERELQKYIEASPGLDKSPAQNEAIFNRLKRAQVLGEQRVQFLTEATKQGASLQQAYQAFDELEKVVPMFKNGEVNEVRMGLSVMPELVTKALNRELTLSKKEEETAAGGGVAEGGGGAAVGVFSPTKTQNNFSVMNDVVEPALVAGARFGESALLGAPSLVMSGVEAGVKTIGGLLGINESQGLTQDFQNALAANRGGVQSASNESPILATGADVIGAFMSPLNKLKAVKTLFSMKGVPGIATRATTTAAQSAVSPYGTGNTGDRVENAALISAGLDLFAKGAGKLAPVMEKAFMSMTGVSAADFREAAKGLGKDMLISARDKFRNAFDIVRKEHGLSIGSLAKGDESVMQDIVTKAQASIKSRNDEIDQIVTAADAALGKPLSPLSIKATSTTDLLKEGVAGANQEEAMKAANAIRLGFVEKLKKDGRPLTLAEIQKEKKILDVTFKPEQVYTDAKSATIRDFKNTIEDVVNKLVSKGLLPREYLDRIRAINKEEGDLIKLRNALAKKLPGAMAEDAVRGVQRMSYTTGGASVAGMEKVGETVAGEAGKQAGRLAALALWAKRVGRPVSYALSKEGAAQFFASPEFRNSLTRGANAMSEAPTYKGDFSSPSIGGNEDATRQLFGLESKKKTEPMRISDAGLGIIKKHEGLRLKAYKDAAGKTTIGYGHTATAEAGKEITEKEADVLLKKDVAAAESAVKRLVTVPLTQNQFDALVSFTYNVGPAALATSTLLKKLNSGDKTVANEFLKWVNAGGKALPGLQARRADEMDLFG